MSTTTIKCENCLKEFARKDSHIKTNIKLKRRNFCCSHCRDEFRSKNYVGDKHPQYKRFQVLCYSCGKILFRSPWEIKRTKNFSCSKKCQSNMKSETYKSSGHPNWQGGKYIGKNGYVYLYRGKTEDTPNGYVAEHTIMAEIVLGRKLKKGEIVHHINLNKSDNRNSNFIICDQSYHEIIHQNMMRAYANMFLGGVS